MSNRPFRDKMHRLIGSTAKGLYLNLQNYPDQAFVTINDVTYKIYPKKSGIHQELYLYKLREPFTTEIVKRIIQKNQCVIDVGSNIGYYALLESKLVGKNGLVFAVEPVLENMKLLRENIRINNAANIRPYQLAFGSENKIDTIFISKTCNWCTLNKTKSSDLEIVGTQPVTVTTVDDFVQANSCKPSFIRMDVEGYEHEILKGMSKTMKYIETLLIEVHPPLMDDVNGFIDILKSNNYRARYVIYENKVLPNKIVDLFTKYERITDIIYKNVPLNKLKEILPLKNGMPNILFIKHGAEKRLGL